MKVLNVAGARPNFMKIAPIIEAMNKFPDRFAHKLIHTGQHYDQNMSKSFFEDLGMPIPDVNLEVGSGTHAVQTAKIMIEFEKICIQEKPDLVVVVGDVNSTMACTITAKKLGIMVAHVEAGLRSRDMSMPEEINRLCTDVLSDFLFTTDHYANENLVSEGIPEDKIHFVGNVMIDTLLKHKKEAEKIKLIDTLGLSADSYATLTMHRPGNVDNKSILTKILDVLTEISAELPIVFPIHPRTRRMIESFGLMSYFNTTKNVEGIWLTEPMGYLDFLHLNMNAKLVLTDSGGLQEETTVLGVPCITMRPNTERPITCEVGTNVMVGNDSQMILQEVRSVLSGSLQAKKIPEKWDGSASERIIQTLLASF